MRPTRRQLPALAGACLAAACARHPARRAPPAFPDAKQLRRGADLLNTRAMPGLLDLGVLDLGSGETWCADTAGHYPLAGLSTLAAAAAALALVDAGRLKLNERVRVTAADLSTPPSRINRRFPEPPGGDQIDLPLADLIGLALQQDDATASDVVMGLAGGPGAVTAWLRGRGVEGMRIDRYDRERTPQMFGLGAFQPGWKDEAAFTAAIEAIAPAARQDAMEAYLADSRDTASAQAVLDLLRKLANGPLLAPASTRFLQALMAARPSGRRGIAQGLPAGATLASVGGATRTSLGFTAADNEAGIVTLPGGGRLAVVVFLAGSTATTTGRAELLADAARLAVGGADPV